MNFRFSFVSIVIARTVIVGGVHFCDLVVDGCFGERGKRERVPESGIKNEKARATASENGFDM
jgi:hypothetical protein